MTVRRRLLDGIRSRSPGKPALLCNVFVESHTSIRKQQRIVPISAFMTMLVTIMT